MIRNQMIGIIKPFNFLPITVLSGLLLAGCTAQDPTKEDTPELVTKTKLTFTPTSGGAPIVVSATDPDGEGVQNIAADGPINLSQSTTYVMTISLINGLVEPGQTGYDITHEVEDEGDEHQFYFSWSGDAFSDPAGNGNVDVGTDPVNYTGASNAKDMNGFNLGITTTWVTGPAPVNGASFRIILKHQPGAKTATSGVAVGETDLDLTFILNVL